MQSLLESIIALNKQGNLQPKENRYNIFSVLGIQEKEVLTCRMIADLLNPRGQHNMGSAFLNLFVRDVLHMDKVDAKILDRAVVTAEYTIDAERRIDIVIEIGEIFIPIEVKIFAGEQKSQCYDYYKFARSKDKEAKVIYLTRFGYMPSGYSMDGEDGSVPEEDMVCISFRDDITCWLKQCSTISSPEISDIIAQFACSIEKITDCAEEVIDKVSDELIKSPETLRAGIQIADAINEAKSRILYAVLAEFENQMIPLEAKYHLKRERQINWYEYADCANASFYRCYSTYPGINYIVEDVKMNDGYQLWLRIEVQHNLYAGFCVFDPYGTSEEGTGCQVDQYNDATKESVDRILKVTKADQEDWWAVWKYLPTGKTKATEEVPNFKEMNDAAIALADEDKRKSFVAGAIQQMEMSLFSLIK